MQCNDVHIKTSNQTPGPPFKFPIFIKNRKVPPLPAQNKALTRISNDSVHSPVPFLNLLSQRLGSSDVRSEPLDHRDASGVLGFEIVKGEGFDGSRTVAYTTASACFERIRDVSAKPMVRTYANREVSK